MPGLERWDMAAQPNSDLQTGRGSLNRLPLQLAILLFDRFHNDERSDIGQLDFGLIQ